MSRDFDINQIKVGDMLVCERGGIPWIQWLVVSKEERTFEVYTMFSHNRSYLTHGVTTTAYKQSFKNMSASTGNIWKLQSA